MNPIRTILHPTDLSEPADPALDLANRLAREQGARLIVLHVVPPPVAYGELGMTIPIPEIQRELLEVKRGKLEALAGDSGAECRVAEGFPADQILRTAREEACDLIVMGTHGRGHLARFFLGSVTAEVLRHAPCSVLALRPSRATAPGAGGGVAPSRPLFPLILHPTDFSEHSRHAFEVACTLGRGGSRLIVLHVVEAVHVASEGYEDALDERLRIFRPDDPTIAVEYRLRQGEPAAEIVAEAEAAGCDLVVLGSHGRTGLDRLLMGSVAEAVLHRAGCMVLAVKTPSTTVSADERRALAPTSS